MIRRYFHSKIINGINFKLLIQYNLKHLNDFYIYIIQMTITQLVNMLINPSLYAHFLHTILLVLAILLVLLNFSKMIHLEPFKIIVLLLFFSLVIGLHGISHLGLEALYGYNPIRIFLSSVAN
jgi:hypothetical protein